MNSAEKPYSPAADRNKDPIYEQLKSRLSKERHKKLIEIGSGTGQHACFLAPKFPFLIWTTSDRLVQHPGIQVWLSEFPSSNIEGPIELELGKTTHLPNKYQALYSANVLHIISWENCLRLFDLANQILETNADIFFYGPFKYQGSFTSGSNETFDQSLKSQSPDSGIKDFEAINEELSSRDFTFKSDTPMPANNQFLHFTK